MPRSKLGLPLPSITYNVDIVYKIETMAESKVISLRIPQDLLFEIDRLAAAQYPSRRPGAVPNRSQVLLNAISAYVSSRADLVNIVNKAQALDAPALVDIGVVRDLILASLKVGKQAPEYKRTKTAMDRFIAELQPQSPVLQTLESLPRAA